VYGIYMMYNFIRCNLYCVIYGKDFIFDVMLH